MKIKGLIAAAGRSSRMDGFKPLMKLNGFPMIQMTVQSLKNGGIEDITVVTGCRAKEMEEVLLPMGVRIVENSAYGETDMLTSVQIGLQKAMEGADGVCFLPGDIPLVSPESMERIMVRLMEIPDETQILRPVVRTGWKPGLVPGGKLPESVLGDNELFQAAHPPVLLLSAYEPVLEYKGKGGLRQLFSAMKAEQVELEDSGALADADYRTDFERLQKYARAHKGVSLEICRELYQEAELPEHIQAHCIAVGRLAGWMAERLTMHGICLDVELCRSGGYLHDLCRLQPQHEAAAGRFLRDRGYLALARIVEQHKGFEKEPESICCEAAIVCTADKLILEDQRVPLEKRYEKALSKTPVKERILRDIRILRRLTREFEVITGEQL